MKLAKLELISDKELQKLQNKYENQYVNVMQVLKVSRVTAFLHAVQDINLINTRLISIVQQRILELLQKNT
jgi:hypothetical protein